jgi:hypothetical protein
MYFVSIDYPVVPPVVLCQVGGATEQLRFAWDGLGDVERCLQVIAQTLELRWRERPAAVPAVAAPAAAAPQAAAPALAPVPASPPPRIAPSADGFTPFTPSTRTD